MINECIQCMSFTDIRSFLLIISESTIQHRRHIHSPNNYLGHQLVYIHVPSQGDFKFIHVFTQKYKSMPEKPSTNDKYIVIL